MTTKKRFYQVGVVTEVCVYVYVGAASERAALRKADAWFSLTRATLNTHLTTFNPGRTHPYCMHTTIPTYTRFLTH